MTQHPYLVGLTGSIGMGKTETAKMFTRLGVPVYDADAAVHRLYEKGGAAVPEIEKMFPNTIENGRVNREKLAKEITLIPDGFKKLEAIVHPLVGREQMEFLSDAMAKGVEMVVLDIPLLFETGGHKRMDAVVVVSAPADVQRARVLAREGMTAEKLDHILSRQMPDAEKRGKAHFVVQTDQGLDDAFEQVRHIVDALHKRRLSGEKNAHA